MRHDLYYNGLMAVGLKAVIDGNLPGALKKSPFKFREDHTSDNTPVHIALIEGDGTLDLRVVLTDQDGVVYIVTHEHTKEYDEAQARERIHEFQYWVIDDFLAKTGIREIDSERSELEIYFGCLRQWED